MKPEQPISHQLPTLARSMVMVLLAGCTDGVTTPIEQTNCRFTVSEIINQDSTIASGNGGGKNRTSLHRPEVINRGKDQTSFALLPSEGCQSWIAGRLTLGSSDAGDTNSFVIPVQMRVNERAVVSTQLRIQMVRNIGLQVVVGPVDLSRVHQGGGDFTGIQNAVFQFPNTDIPGLATQL